MPTLDFCCGAECGITVLGAASGVRHWDTQVGTAPTVETTIVRSPGLRAYRWDTTGAAASRYWGKNFTGTDRLLRFAFRFETLPNIDTTICQVNAAAGPNGLYRYIASSQSMQPWIGALVGGTAVAIVTGRWYVVDLLYQVGTNPTRNLTAQILDTTTGVLTTQGNTPSNQAFSSITLVRWGIGTDATTPTADLIIDDMGTGSTVADYPVGNGKVAGLFMASDGAHSFNAVTDFKYNNSTNMPSTSPTDTFSYLDDPLDNITDFLACGVGIAAGEYLEWLPQSCPVVPSINGVQITESHHSAGVNANKATLRIVDGGTTVDHMTDFDVSETVLAFNTAHYATAPSGGAWTKAKIDGLKFRWGSSWGTVDVADLPYIDGLVLEVDYPVTAAAAISGTLASAATESDVRAGGKTIILDLTGATWIP